MSDRHPTANDVKLAETTGKWRFRTNVVWLVGAVFLTAASSLPILAMARIFDHLAGKETSFVFNGVLAVSLTVNIPAALITAWSRMKLSEQRKELQRLRERSEKLEQDLSDCRARQRK